MANRSCGIIKRGSKCLRKLIIQGAREALPFLTRTAPPLGGWLRGLLMPPSRDVLASYRARYPERYGVVQLDKAGKAISIEEKPKAPKSS